MLQYIIRRLLWSVVMLLLITVIVFTIFFVLPGGGGQNVAVLMAGKNPSPRNVENITERLGLDEPVYVQFGKYVWNAIRHGDLGDDYHNNLPVTERVFDHIPATASLAIGASIVWLLIGIPIGVISALKRRSLMDRGSMLFALIGVSLPTFWLGLMVVFLFDFRLNWYSVGDYARLTEDPVNWLRALWLPWLVLAVTQAAFYTRMVRGNMLEVQGEDYIRTARAKGLRERSVIRHALRSALTPVVTMYGLDLGILMGGAIITEAIFNIPGIGGLVVDAIQDSNFPVIMGTTLVASFAVIAANLLVDIVYASLDPRVTYS
jgi:peptide/nickel transport system permease protein